MVARFWRDITFAGRILAKRLGFSSVVVSILALGIGSTTAIISVVSSVLLAPLPYPDSDRLLLIQDSINRAVNRAACLP